MDYEAPLPLSEASKIFVRALKEMSCLVGSLVIPGLEDMFGSKLYHLPEVEGRWPHVPAMLCQEHRQQSLSALVKHFTELESPLESPLSSRNSFERLTPQFRLPRRTCLKGLYDLPLNLQSAASA